MALDDQQIDQFRREGYLRLGSILDRSTVDALLSTEARHRPEASYGDGGTTGLLVRDQLCDQSVALRDVCTRGPHVALLADLLGPDVAFTHTQFITKLPEPDHSPGVDDQLASSFIPFHQDDGYGTLDPPIDVTVWFALTDTDETNGCLRVVPGSHLDGVLPHEAAATNAALREVRVAASVPVQLVAGEAVAFTGLTLHGSGPNRSGAPRVGMHTRYCLPTARMVTEGGRAVLEDRHSWMVLGEAPMGGWTSANDKFLDAP